MPEPASAPQIREIMNNAIAFSQGIGLRTRLEMEFVSDLKQGGEITFPWEAKAGDEREVSAACVPDCGQLSIVGKDAGGTVVNYRNDPNRTSVILVNSAATMLTVTITAPECPTASCAVGVWMMAH